jgi:hypothetical protein
MGKGEPSNSNQQTFNSTMYLLLITLSKQKKNRINFKCENWSSSNKNYIHVIHLTYFIKFLVKGKDKDSPVGSRGIGLLFQDLAARRDERSAARPGRILPPKKARYPLYRRLGGPQGRSGRAENYALTGIQSCALQSVVSPYTD